MSSDINKYIFWLKLKSVGGVGNLLFKKLLKTFTVPENVFNASYEELFQVEGVNGKIAKAIKNYKISDALKRDIEIVNEKNYQFITINDKNYPSLLLQLPDPPPYLYLYGKLNNKSNKNIAFVGSRKATSYGISTAKKLSKELASLDITIVSGMAKGIDTAAHVGALEANGKTIAVLGSGLEKIYPAENKKLFHKIAENGAVISEFSPFAEPLACNFPIRNRLISGMCIGTVVVEASKKSGSLITARLAAEQNREVFAVPGSIYSHQSAGTHALIKQGAKLIENANDILEEFSTAMQVSVTNENILPDDTANKLKTLPDNQLKVFKTLGPYPKHIDELARNLNMESGKLSGVLMNLELKGLIHQTPGKFFSIEIKTKI